MARTPDRCVPASYGLHLHAATPGRSPTRTVPLIMRLAQQSLRGRVSFWGVQAYGGRASTATFSCESTGCPVLQRSVHAGHFSIAAELPLVTQQEDSPCHTCKFRRAFNRRAQGQYARQGLIRRQCPSSNGRPSPRTRQTTRGAGGPDAGRHFQRRFLWRHAPRRSSVDGGALEEDYPFPPT
jgi:hypothetical protein